jgi:hypothetical protein
MQVKERNTMARFTALLRPSPSMAVAMIALVVALGGTGYAAVTLPKNSVGAKQLKRNAVTGAKVKDQSLFANDFASGQLPRGPKGDSGPTGPQGAPGATGGTGAQGPPGLSQVIVRRHLELIGISNAAGSGNNLITMQLPPGKWLLSAVTNGFYDFNPGAVFRCYLMVNGVAKDDVQTLALGTVNGAIRGGVFTPGATVDTTTTKTVVLRCDHFEAAPKTAFGPSFGPSRITAIRANTLDAADA